MANAQDFLLAIDDHLRQAPDDVIVSPTTFWDIARDSNVASYGHHLVGMWVGTLVHAGYLVHGAPHYGRDMPPVGVSWNNDDMQRASSYSLTAAGHARADALRRQARDQRADAIFGMRLPTLPGWLPEAFVRGVSRCAKALDSALVAEEPLTVIGCSKELVESTAKARLTYAGSDIPDGLPALFKAALSTAQVDAGFGRRLGGVVTLMAERRNELGAQHGGHPEEPPTSYEAHVVAGAAIALATLLLEAPFDGS